MKRNVAYLASLAILMAASSANALELASEMYVVGSVGRATVVTEQMQSTNDNMVMNALARYSSFDSTQASSKRGYKLQLGYEFTPNFAIEGGYVDLGKTTYSANYANTTTTPTTITIPGWFPITIPGPPKTVTTTGSASREAKIAGWNIAALGIYPFNDKFSAFGKLGMIRAQVKSNDAGAGFATGSDTTETKWKTTYGLGGNYQVNSSLGIRAEYERFSKLGASETTGAADVNLLSLGLVGRF